MSVFSNIFREMLSKADVEAIESEEKQDKKHEKEIRSIDVSRLRVSTLKLRDNVNKADIVDLAANIKQNGIIEPLSVRKISPNESPFGELFEIISGERRFFACLSLKITEIPCFVVEIDDEKLLISQLIEKIHSKPLHYLDEAQGIKILLDTFFEDKSKACDLLSVSASYISNKLRLLELSEYEKNLIRENDIEQALVQTVMKIPSPEKRVEALEYIIYNRLSLNETLRYVDKNIKNQRKARACIGYSEQKNDILMKSLSDIIKNEKILANIDTIENDREMQIQIRLPKKYK